MSRIVVPEAQGQQVRLGAWAPVEMAGALLLTAGACARVAGTIHIRPETQAPPSALVMVCENASEVDLVQLSDVCLQTIKHIHIHIRF